MGKIWIEFDLYSTWHVSKWGVNEPYWNLPPGGAKVLWHLQEVALIWFKTEKKISPLGLQKIIANVA